MRTNCESSCESRPPCTVDSCARRRTIYAIAATEVTPSAISATSHGVERVVHAEDEGDGVGVGVVVGAGAPGRMKFISDERCRRVPLTDENCARYSNGSAALKNKGANVKEKRNPPGVKKTDYHFNRAICVIACARAKTR